MNAAALTADAFFPALPTVTTGRSSRARARPHVGVGARPLLELAKETYCEALRLDSGRRDARCNLERALRLAPEEEDVPAEPLPMGGESERSVTTMRAFTLGLP